jgi:isopentenyl-diphosphate Delta-isomerase
MMKQDDVVLVNEKDEPLGQMEKMEAHRKGLLHRAFSVFIFNSEGKMLLQQRAADKYHGAYLWTNACCSHPFPGEDVHVAAKRRLKEELGFQTEIEKIFDFIYIAPVENDLIEHEFDHVFAGSFDGIFQFNPHEVMDTKFLDLRTIRSEIESEPERFTAWFKIAFPRIEEWWGKKIYE